MDEQLLKTVSRQLRTIKLLLGFFFVLFLIMLAILGFITYKVVTFTHDVTTKINTFQNSTTQTLDLKKQLCDSKTIVSFLDNKSELCK